MAELQRHLVRRHAEAKRPTVDVERWDGRVAGLVDARADRGRIRIEQSRGKSYVAETRGHEDVRLSPTLEQQAAHIGAIHQGVLRRRGLVIDTAHVDSGAALEEKRGNRDGLCLVERLLTITSPGVYEGAVAINQRPQFVEPTQARGHVRGQRGTVCQEEARGVLAGVV